MDILVVVGVGVVGFLLGWAVRATRDNSGDAAMFNKVSRDPGLGRGVSFESPGSTPTNASVPATPSGLAAAPNQAAAPDPNAFQWTQVDNLLKQRNKILAIKVFREQTGTGLKAAKEAVERRERELRGKR